ncbi:MAG: nucleoside triphosphate pyrophosphohydrolase [Leptospiraceae bacterium]|nr:nucleoside triphosphate pyrophosphohydrolase [Leptospiraceae bacterium]MDW8306836.1 nucleoside triphosphate pyrophosphohydrolase [Leptospiraceae bacterium]
MKIPPKLEKNRAIEALLQVAQDLRDPQGGCPWDLKQTHDSLRKNLIEEAYELDEAIMGLKPDDPQSIEKFQEELGDLLFQVVIHCQLAREKEWFDFEDVVIAVAEKLILRHPHVYGKSSRLATSEEVLQKWEAQKLAEKQRKNSTDTSILAGLPRHMPALLRAYRQGERAGRLNFDWPRNAQGITLVREKIKEEMKELERELPVEPSDVSHVSEAQKKRVYEEFGDLLYAVVQYARLFGVNPEEALHESCNKFEERFRAMEAEFAQRLSLGDIPSLEEWSEVYYKIKEREKSSMP